MHSPEKSFLTPKQLLQEQVVMRKFFNLIHDEKPRYLRQAAEFLTSHTLEIQINELTFKYCIENEMYTYSTIRGIDDEDSIVGQFPIPDNQAARIEALIELFAQSEAGFIL